MLIIMLTFVNVTFVYKWKHKGIAEYKMLKLKPDTLNDRLYLVGLLN